FARPDKPAMAPRNLSIYCNKSCKIRRAGGTVGLPNGAGDHGSFTRFTTNYKRIALTPADENPEPLKD
ncbi:MAG: hypothetical protein CME33_14720, partial [Gimesia sp.]|uniref:hypothetical protein n=1 Tax=Gimesia sp. TaxID=2024833 RepID=UPI000C3597A2